MCLGKVEVMRQASTDRSVRNLGALQRTASTSRVLNLVAIANSHKGEPDYHTKPFFTTPILNECIVLKHRIRADERYVFDDERQNSTKFILPFERGDLRMGGRSFFVGQRGWRNIVREAGGEALNIERDIRVMSAVDEVPSLDPFLLREHLNRRGIQIASCYFAISEADLGRMQDFVSMEINNLIRLTYATAGEGSSYSSKLVQVLLSTEINEHLEPLRIALRLEGEDHLEGFFSWKGFLYYKWVLNDLWPQLVDVLQEMWELKKVGPQFDSILEAHLTKKYRGLQFLDINENNMEMTVHKMISQKRRGDNAYHVFAMMDGFNDKLQDDDEANDAHWQPWEINEDLFDCMRLYYKDGTAGLCQR